MPRVPRPEEMPRAALDPAHQPAQINMRVAESIGQSGRAMGNAIAAIGNAFGEVAGKIGQANDATNYDNARLEWLKGDQTIQDDTRQQAGEDGAAWQGVPQRYADLNKSIDERFPISNPAQKRQLDFWREQNTFNRGIGAAREYQGAQRNQFLRGFDQDVSGLEERIGNGEVDPTMFGQHYDALTGKLGSMSRTVLSQAEIEAKTRELQSRLVGATDRYLAAKDPAERERFWGQVRGGRFEIDQNTQGGASNVQIKNDGAYSIILSSAGANLKVSSQYADRFAGLVSDLEAAGIKADPNQSGGFNYRNIRGTNTLSRHATGEAIDLNWNENARGGPGAIRKQLGEDQIRSIAAKWGMKWGGDWKNPDDMHFEVDRKAQPQATFQQAKAQGAIAANVIRGNVTAYSPQAGASNTDSMEGNYQAARPGPDGKAEVRTLEDFASGQSKYITVAGNPKFNGREYTIPKIEFVGKDGKVQVLENVPAVVHDTGSAFKNAPEGRFDIPVARDADDAVMSRNHGLWKKSGIEFVPGGATQKPVQVADAGGSVPANDNAGQPAAGGEVFDQANAPGENDPAGSYPTAGNDPGDNDPGGRAYAASDTASAPVGGSQIPMGRLAPGQVFTVNTPRGPLEVKSEWINALPQRTREQMARQSGEQYRLFERGRQSVAKGMIEDGEVNVALHGRPSETYDAATVRAAFAKDPETLRKHGQRMAIAKAVYDETSNFANMPSDDIVNRMSELEQKYLAEGSSDASTKKIMDLVVKKTDALLKQREADPAGSVEGSQEVRSVREKLIKGEPRNKLDAIALIQARLMAQTRLDIPEQAQSPLTRRELLTIAPSLRGLEPGTAAESIEKTYGMIRERYGEKYAPMILRKAIDTTVKQRALHDSYAAMLTDIVERENTMGPPVPPGFKPPPKPGVVDRLYQMLPSMPSPRAIGDAIGLGSKSTPAGEAAPVYPKPNDAAINALKKNPTRAADFDAQFGPGSAEKAIPGINRLIKLEQLK